MFILGISALYHDSAACLIKNGEILAAAQEERFSRKRHDASFPSNSIKFCLEFANIGPEKIDYVVFYEKPFVKFERILETYLAFAPRGFKSFAASLPTWVKGKLSQRHLISAFLSENLGHSEDYWSERLLFSDHHLSHAASAFFPSPFEDAAILTMDGVGEWSTTTLGLGNGNKITLTDEIKFPHSLGLLYSAITYYLGFKVNSGEYKVMGLAPYGKPIYNNVIKENLIDIKPDGTFRLNLEYFDFCTNLRMTNSKFDTLFDNRPPRNPESKLTQIDMDIAASIQNVTEEVVLKLANSIQLNTKQKNLCIAGGVALNCVANGKLQLNGPFENIWIQPASGDAGGCIGAALSIHHLMLNKPRIFGTNKNDLMSGSYLGPKYSQADIERRLNDIGAIFTTMDEDVLLKETAKELASGNAIGWHQGRMEFGPRALGNRSILADPRSSAMQKILNLKVKYRESFRPFAPSVLFEDLKSWFKTDTASPYMLFVSEVVDDKQIEMTDVQKALFGIEKLNTPRSLIPAVTHVDYSARIQTVHKNTNKKFYDLIDEFKKLTGVPLLVNTSFNIRGEPIVETPEDAFKCFMGTDLDILVIGNCMLWKDQQTAVKPSDYLAQFDLD